MKARQIHEGMKELGTWVDWERTRDIFQHGDPEMEVRKVAVGWMCTLRALRLARAWGCQMFITHEPMYYDHNGRDPEIVDHPAYQHKIKGMEELRMVVYRCHDVWDRMPEYGVQASWDRGLGWADQPLHWRNDFCRIYELKPQPLSSVARYVLGKLQPLGQKAVRIVGDPGRVVRRVGVGTGCTGGISTFQTFLENGADAVIATEVNNWIDVPWADDAGLGLIVCNHSISEQWAMQNLVEYLTQKYPAVEFRYVPPEVIYNEIILPAKTFFAERG